MSTQEPNVPYGTTGERLKAFAVNEATRERIGVLATKYWEAGAYALLLISAAILRFYNLGERAMHHDESLHGFYSYEFTRGLRDFFSSGSSDITYRHVPFMHGPFQFIGNGFMMWIFGDGDYQARILAAVMGTALVFMPFLLRRQLGTFGALAAAAFIAFSPTLMYYSRFTREDIYTAFWTFGIVIAMWRYLASRDERWLYGTAGLMAMLFLTKETSYFTLGAFIGFVDYLFAVHIADNVRAKARTPMTSLRYGGLVLALMPVAWLIAITWPFTQERRARYGLSELPAEANLLIVMGTLAVPHYAAAVQLAPGFGEAWQDRSGTPNIHVADPERTAAFLTIFLLIAASAVTGMLWRARTWIIAATAFWVPYILLSTTFFSNPDGFFSVMWGSLDYWISQQEVARGSQPNYYYFITIPVYEFLPLGLAIAALLYYGVRGNAQRALIVGAGLLAILISFVLPAGPDISRAPLMRVWVPFLIVLVGVMTLPMQAFNRFLLFWVVVTTFALTVASEKMPWLNVHIALGLAVLAGRFVGEIIERGDLKADLPKLERIAPFAYAAIASALAVFVFVLTGPFSVAAVGAWMLALVAVATVYWAFTGYSRRTAVQVALVGAVAAFTVFSVRAGWLASWGHPDNPYVGGAGSVATRDYGDVPVELLVYTQTSGDIPVLRDKVDKYARDTGLGRDLPIVVDSFDGFTWPWAWYLRDYRSVSYVEVQPGHEPPQGAVLFIGKQNASNVNLGGHYEPGLDYHHRRWFPEDYRGDGDYRSSDFFNDLASVDALSYWLDFWVTRKLPAPEPGTTDGVAFFPIGSGVVPVEPAGPTVRVEGTQIVIGGQGPAKGQLNAPSDVALDSAGNIYVADTNNDRIQKYDPNGVFLAAVGGFTAREVTLNDPWSMTVADDGTLFVADTWAHRILKFDANLVQVDEWGAGCTDIAAGCDPFQLFAPREITLNTNGNVLIADTGNHRIIEYTPDGDFVREFGSNGEGGGALEYNEPVGVEVNAAGDFYIADFWNQRIVVIDSDLNLVREIPVGAWGSRAVTDRPYLAVLADGRVLATDPTNGKVLAFAADGTPLGEYDLPKEGNAPFARPVGIASDGASVIVADAASGVVRKIPLGEVVR